MMTEIEKAVSSAMESARAAASVVQFYDIQQKRVFWLKLREEISEHLRRNFNVTEKG
jgi:hypothetical protein